jgi:hypothetical protein
MRYTFLASFGVTLLATAAFAQGGGQGGRMGMVRADTNGDGMISKTEAAAQASARFDRMDANKDGTLTADELKGPGGRMMARAVGGDGAMTRAEFLAQADKRFARIDTNKDGQLSPDELKVWADKARAFAAERRADPADAIAPPAPAAKPNPGQ